MGLRESYHLLAFFWPNRGMRYYDGKDCFEGPWISSVFIPVFTEGMPGTQFDFCCSHTALPVWCEPLHTCHKCRGW